MSKRCLILQYFGLGDATFGMGVAEHFRKQGYDVTWPVLPCFLDGLQRAYPHIDFESYEKYDQNLFNIKEDTIVDGYRIIPMRWSDRLVGKESKWWMRTKYDLYNLDYTKWKESAEFVRHPEKEKELFSLLGLEDGEEYNLINSVFRSNMTGKVKIEVNNGLKNIELPFLPDYSLFDTALLIEKATTINVVNSAIFYLLELLPLQAKEIHLYSRIPDEVGFPYVHYLMTKDYILHE
jgi:hypothetical protein